ncbi:hypothetical protein EV715DRAFT_271286 [Schizophyllum commune]
MRAGLERLAAFVGDRSIADRDPRSAMSFSTVGPEVLKSQTEMLAHYSQGEDGVFSPLGPDGRPLRRVSERKREHWFHSEKDGLSYAGNVVPLPAQSGGKNQPQQQRHRRSNSVTDTTNRIPHSEPISTEAVKDGRLRRTNHTSAGFNANTVEKHVIKGSMAKVVAQSTAQSGRLRL